MIIRFALEDIFHSMRHRMNFHVRANDSIDIGLRRLFRRLTCDLKREKGVNVNDVDS